MDYKQARSYLYPDQYTFFESLYPFASNGDSSRKAALDAHIDLVHNTIPADSTTYTEEELELKLIDLKKNELFLSSN